MLHLWVGSTQKDGKNQMMYHEGLYAPMREGVVPEAFEYSALYLSLTQVKEVC